MPTSKILLVRCSRLPHFRKALEQVLEKYPDHEIHVLAKHSLAAECGALPGVQRVLQYPDRPFSLPGIFAMKSAIRRAFYTLAVVPVSSSAITEYLNVELAMLPLRFARIATFFPSGVWFERDRAQFRWRDLPRNIFLYHAERLDTPFLFILLLAAQLLRPVRWFKERWPRSSVEPAVRRKVMHCIPSLGMGGAQRQMLKVIEAMGARHDVSLCVLTDNDFFFRNLSDKAGVKTYVLNSGTGSYALSVVRLYRLLRREHIDVLQMWLPMANVIGAIAGNLAGTPRIIASERCLTSSKQIWYPQWWFRWVDALAARLCTSVTANSHAVLDDYVKWTRLKHKRLAVVHNGVDAGEFTCLDATAKELLRSQLGLKTGEAVVGIIGRLEAEKDHPTFLRAIQLLSRGSVRVRALIIGGGSQSENLQAMAADMGLSDKVLFLGNRPDATSLMQICDAVVLTSRTEGMPNVLLEAQLLGVPVITTDAGGCREVVSHGHTGYVVPIGDDGLIATYIETLLTARTTAETFSEKGKIKMRKEFNLERTVFGFESLYLKSPQ